VRRERRTGGGTTSEFELRPAAGAVGPGLAGSDVLIEGVLNGVTTGTLGLKSSGRIVGFDRMGSGLRYEADHPHRSVTAIHAFLPNVAPSATTALARIDYSGVSAMTPTAVTDRNGLREAPVRIRDGVVERRVLDAQGQTLMTQQVTLGRRGEITRIETIALVMPRTVEEREHTVCNQLVRVVVNGREAVRREPRFGCQNLGETLPTSCTASETERRCQNQLVEGYGYIADWVSWCDAACKCLTQFICDSPTGFCSSSPYGAGRYEWSPFGGTESAWCR
jgi:hypothetical protein